MDSIGNLSRMLRSVSADELHSRCLTPLQFIVLKLIKDGTCVRLSDLASRLELSASSLSGVVDRLVQMGQLRREEDQADRRVHLLHVTEQGDKDVKALHTAIRAILLDTMNELQDEQVLMIAQGLTLLAQCIGQRREQA